MEIKLNKTKSDMKDIITIVFFVLFVVAFFIVTFLRFIDFDESILSDRNILMGIAGLIIFIAGGYVLSKVTNDKKE